jgi:large subunit ribosomal protein L9
VKVILNQTVPKLGKQGQVVSVANGYARNFLFPRGLAIVADRKQIAALQKRSVRVDARAAETRTEAQELRERLHGKLVRVAGKVGGEGTKLFGSITSQDVADLVQEQLGVQLEKRQVALVHAIKRLGDHEVIIDLHKDVEATVMVQVFDPEAPEPEPEAAPAPAEAEPAATEA